MSHPLKNRNNTKGFTLLELLIVIAIIAILSVALILTLNPAETLKKSRDSQRISDLNTLKTALSLYVSGTSTPYIGGLSDNTACKTSPSSSYASGDKIFYSLPSGSSITDSTLDDGSLSVPSPSQVATPALADGTGWIPVNFNVLTGGSPISNLPVDPINTITSLSTVAFTDFVYRYACSVTPFTFEIDAQLESDAYTANDNKRALDGGNNNNLYEVGSNLGIMGAGATAQF